MVETKVTNWSGHDDRMVEDAIRRGATRRDLLKMLAVGGIGLAAGAPIVMQATNAYAETPKSGGHLTAAGWSSSTADTLDPIKSSLSTDYVRCAAFYNRLTFLDENGKVQMELAESLESDDAKTWTLKLRKGVTFHDGKKLTVDDVIFSLNRNKEKSANSYALAKQMETFKKVNDHEMQIILANSNADLPTILSLVNFFIVADGTTDFSKGNGTGAFICKEFQPGVRSVAVKNPHYWKENRPYLDSFEFVAISDNSARVNALLAGQVQLAASVDPRSKRQLANEKSVKLSITTSGNYTDLIAHLDMPPGDKEGFIEGLKYVINRDAIKHSVMRDLAVIANDQPVSPTDRYYNKDLKPKPFDLDKAKFYFKKAGLTGQPIPLIASEAATSSIDMATVVQQSAAGAGVQFAVKRVPSAGYWSNYWLKSPLAFGNINPRPTPDILFSLFYASDAPWNESKYKSAKFDKMLVEARGLLDEKKRKDIYDEMQVMVSEQAGTIIPVWISNMDALSSKLMGLKPNPLGGMMGYAFAEYVWLES